jgi:DNA polymerase delta subunit 1
MVRKFGNCTGILFVHLFQTALNRAVLADMRSNKEAVQEAVLAVELVQRLNLVGYNGEDKLGFIKITVALPQLIAPAKRLLEKDLVYPPAGPHNFQPFESNIDFDIR